MYVLLSLLLVLSQQMGIAHGLTHWPQRDQAGQRQDGRQAPKPLASEQGCAQCLAFAQIGSALDAPRRTILATPAAAPALAGVSARPACRRTVCVFQSRAPPAA
jgi:hypothetical protein